MKSDLRKLALDPGVLFALGNIFAFMQSSDLWSIVLAIVTAVFAVAVSYSPRLRELCAHGPAFIVGDPDRPALRITAYGTLISGLFSLAAGAILPGLAGLAFPIGNFLASNISAQRVQENPHIQGWSKVSTNPAVYYGIGYAMIGLMAGGGWQLLAHPFAHIPPLITTFLGVAATSLSSFGLALGKFRNPAAPFMTVAFGTAVNAVSGLLSGNLFGVINNLFAMCGETRLGQLNYGAYKKQPRDERVDTGDGLGKFFDFVSKVLLLPLRALDRKG